MVLEKQEESPAVNHGPLAEEVVPSPGAPLEITIADMPRRVKGEEKKRTSRMADASRPERSAKASKRNAALQKHRLNSPKGGGISISLRDVTAWMFLSGKPPM